MKLTLPALWASVRARWTWMGWLPLLVLIGIAPAQATWPLAHLELLPQWIDNELPQDLRAEFMGAIFVSLLVTVAFYGATYAVVRRGLPSIRFGDFARALNRSTFVVIAFPLLVTLLGSELEREQPVTTLLLITLSALLIALWVERVTPRARTRVPSTRLRRLAGPLAVLVLTVAYAVGMSYLSVLDHHNLRTSFLDLSVYDNILWHTASGDWLGCSMCAGENHLSVHFDPILIAIAPLYALDPRAETLLIVQSVWLATGTVPLFRLGRRRLRSDLAGVTMAAAYVLYPALHGANLYDFHSLTLVVPLLLWAVELLDRGSTWRFLAVFAAILATREDLALLMCFLGLYAGMRGRGRMGWLIVGVSLAYFGFARGVVMSGTKLLAKGHFVGRYSEMIPHRDENLSGLVVSVFTNPGFVVQVLLREEKLIYYASLLVPLGLLPLWAGTKRVLFVYGLIFIGLSNHRYHYSLHFQYGVVLFPLLLAAVPEGIDRVAKRLRKRWGVEPARARRALLLFVMIASVLSSSKFGALVPNASFRAGWTPLLHTADAASARRHRAVRSLAKGIDPDAAVCASDELSPHVSNRATIARWPRCKDADVYLVRPSKMKPKGLRRWKRVRKRLRLVDKKRGIEHWEVAD